MDAARIDTGDGRVKLDYNRVPDVDGAALGEIHLQFGRFIGVNALQFLDFLQLAFVQLFTLSYGLFLLVEQFGKSLGAVSLLLGLLFLFLDLGIGLAVAEADGIGHLLQLVGGVGAQVGHRHDDGVGLDHRRVGDPVEQRVVIDRAFHAVPVALVFGRSQHLELRQAVVGGAEEHI